MNARSKDNVRDLLIITHDRIQEVLGEARKHYDALAMLCDAIALLDMCHSFADVTSLSSKPWCRPLVSKRSREPSADSGDSEDSAGGMMIRNGWYPIVIQDAANGLDGDGPTDFVPNDTFVSDDKSFTVITGVNGAG